MDDKRWQQAIIPLMTMDFEGNIRTVNDSFLEMVDYSVEELIGEHFEKLMDNGTKFFFNSMLYPNLRIKKQIHEMYICLRTSTHEVKHVMFNAQVIEPEHFIHCFIIPVPQRMEHMKEIRTINKALEETLKEKTRLHEELLTLTEELKRFAERDWLTTLYNRRVFMLELERTYETFQQDERVFSICVLDVDHFKQVNDQNGHHVGDDVLIGLAQEMEQFFDASCTLARFGGEEFIILLPDVNQHEAYEAVENFRKRVKQQVWQGINITISAGISMVSYPSEISELIAAADRALYQAKHNGRDQVKLVEEQTKEIENVVPLEEYFTDSTVQRVEAE